MTGAYRRAIVVALLLVAVSGCAASPAPSASPVPLPTKAAPATGSYNEALAYQSAWHVEAKSRYVTGSIDTCDLNTPISIEDAAALADSSTTIPIFGAVFRDGQITYGTVWPTPVPGTGILSGTGTYAISYDSSGLPTTASGTARLKWRDPKKKPVVSTRTDQFTLTFTKEPRADHCQ